MNRFFKFLSDKPPLTVTLARTETLENCANCGAVLTGSYCSHCGQKKEHKDDFKISHFLGETFHAFTHFDAKFFTSIRELFRKPGSLTTEFIRGHRKKYMNPIQLFFVANIIFFLFSIFNTFTTPLHNQLEGRLNTGMKLMVDSKIKKEGISYKDYELRFNEKETSEAKTLIIIMIPIFAFLMSLMFLNQHRYFLEHLVFSLHIFSFVLYFLTFGVYIIWAVLAIILIVSSAIGGNMLSKAFWLRDYLNTDSAFTIVMSFILFTYLFIAIRKVYSQSIVETTFKSFAAIFIFWITIITYRYVLFFTTFYGLRLSLH